ncbi:MAG: sensor histidine kinase [Anaerolineae bacterium]|nr:sensor histidine kinase [Anaerolineae bacterium]
MSVKPETNQTPLLLPVGLAAQLLMSHLAAALLAGVLVRGEIASARGALALVVGAAAGMAITLPIRRTIWQVVSVLRKLNGGQSPPGLSTRWHGPLADLAAQTNTLAGRIREVTALRENLLHQTRESAAQQERNRLARDLHDSIKQQIFSVSMSAAAVQARWDDDPDGAREALADVRSSTQEAMVEMNALLQQLSPAPLEKVGLVQALRDQCEALDHRVEAEVSTEFGPLPDDALLPPGAQESVFRIAQEALSNIARHARASSVRLYLGQRHSNGPLMLEIADDGQGFDSAEAKEGMGLSNIRQRVMALGGELSIDSLPGEGTTLRVSVPLVEPIEPGEEILHMKPDHRLNKTFLAGLGGGIALIAVLFYPLYVLLPGRFVEGWITGMDAVGALLEIAAVLIAAATGFLAAKWVNTGTRQGGALIGALAGGVAAAIMYFGLGASAAGVMGSAFLLDYGLIAHTDDIALAHLIAETATSLAWWQVGGFWIIFLSGIGLGSVGGLLAPPAAENDSSNWSKLRLPGTIILITSALVSAILLMFAVSVFSTLELSIRVSLAESGASPGTSLPLWGISFWMIGTPAVFYFSSLISVYLLIREETLADDLAGLDTTRSLSIVLGLLSLAISVLLMLMKANLEIALPVLNLAYIAMVSLSLVIGGLYLVLFAKINRRRRRPGPARPNLLQAAAAVGIVLSAAGIIWAVGQSLVVNVVTGLAIIAADALLVILLRRQVRKAAPDEGTSRNTRIDMPRMLAASLGSGLAFVIPTMSIVGVVVSLLVFLAAPIEATSNHPFHLADLVRGAYLTQARVCLFVLVGATAGIGLGILVVGGIRAIANRPTALDRESDRAE